MLALLLDIFVADLIGRIATATVTNSDPDELSSRWHQLVSHGPNSARQSGGKESVKRRLEKREADIASAAAALNRLVRRNDVKEYQLTDIASESKLPLARSKS